MATELTITNKSSVAIQVEARGKMSSAAPGQVFQSWVVRPGGSEDVKIHNGSYLAIIETVGGY